MTPEERAAEMAKRVLKRKKLTSSTKKQLKTLLAKAGNKTADVKQERKAKSAAAVKAALDYQRRQRDAARHRKSRKNKKLGLSPAPKPRKDALTPQERAAKQRVYVHRNTLRKQGKSEAEINHLAPLPSTASAPSSASVN